MVYNLVFFFLKKKKCSVDFRKLLVNKRKQNTSYLHLSFSATSVINFLKYSCRTVKIVNKIQVTSKFVDRGK